jgi:predicted Zn-dependent protease
MNNSEAESYMLKIMAQNEGNSEAMVDMARFYLKINKIDKAEEYMRDAYSFQIKNKDYALIYATFLIQIGRCKEAYIILKKLDEDNYERNLVYLILSLSFEQDSDPILA